MEFFVLKCKKKHEYLKLRKLLKIGIQKEEKMI